jgi:pimeloyl-ACP methyl ester carboxylesterase
MKLNIQGAHIVGTSYGGFVAFWLAYKYPQLCWKVVLASTGICMTPETNNEVLKLCHLRSIADLLLPTTCDGLKLSMSFLHARPPAIPDFLAQQNLDIYYKQEDRQQRVELLHALVIGSPNCPQLPVLNQEVLIVWGREDHLMGLNLAKQLQEHLGRHRAQLFVIEGAGHMPQLEKWREFNAVISDFLEESVSSHSRSY